VTEILDKETTGARVAANATVFAGNVIWTVDFHVHPNSLSSAPDHDFVPRHGKDLFPELIRVTDDCKGTPGKF
jgi:hypothetical protein